MASRLSCPSAPAQPNSVVIGVVRHDDAVGPPRVAMLRRAVPLNAIASLIPTSVPAAEVLRLAAPCAEARCRHFAHHRCTLVARMVEQLPAVIGRAPPCALRPTCRWWHQEGVAACRRCPQVLTEPVAPDPRMRDLAVPQSAPSVPQPS